MDRTRLAPAVGMLACLAYLATLSLPFGSTSAGVYYASGVVNPLIGGLFASITIVVFAAGRQDRTDPALAAGIALAFGLVMTVTAIGWAGTARTDIPSIIRVHRHALVGTAAVIPIVAIWYAVELDVL